MNIKLSTRVKGNYKDVMASFDRQLFEALAPKHVQMEIVEFTGSKKGDRVHIRFTSPIKAEWISVITENKIEDHQAYFTDEGTTLPMGLKYWKHKHLVKKISETESEIIDDITFKGSNALVTLAMYPGIYVSFYPRKNIYQKYFGK